ncbi:amidase [Lutibaculum baratangense]|uniref:Aspartyl-tRNA(Asn) amidotransferase subunit A n=1 Tax=Lutibaculum baratangense AMV1 TaxID=631454 RepID=V4TLB1_9HYPH|nr:amidase [Lutibaculum baratangense]ESR26603.1 Aspartyl-tRNA(Asn) amidotransferase subunit A [Lutibaculum baratangense AMV1]
MRARDRELTAMSATALAELIAKGTVTAVEATKAHLDRIDECDGEIGAWEHLDREFALRQAAMLDKHRASGAAIGPLHGVPVGIKDIIDVEGLPCEHGTPLDAGRRPAKDAHLVSRLRQSGAVILGKTVTTELAVFAPNRTTNPHDATRTPGGSSQGSAAAVAAHMAPLSVGTQTHGSVIRPASYCGVVGFKPSYGLISRAGVLTQSPTLDTIGGFSRTIEDVALLTDAMCGFDEDDTAMRLVAAPQLRATATSRPPLRPVLAFVRTPVWDQAEADVHQGFEELVAELGDCIEEVELPSPFQRAVELQRVIQMAEIARHYGPYYDRGREQLSPTMQGLIEEGRRVLAVDHMLARDWIKILYAGLEQVFERFDAIVTPAAVGEAPVGLESTGSPVFSTLWTYCGVPALTIPLLSGSHGMPIGVQLVGARGRDGRLLRTGRWLVEHLNQSAGRAVA